MCVCACVSFSEDPSHFSSLRLKIVVRCESSLTKVCTNRELSIEFNGVAFEVRGGADVDAQDGIASTPLVYSIRS